MDQKAYLAVAAMLNSFPSGNNNPDLTLGTYESVLQGISPQAVTEAAQRFVMGDVSGQSKTFAPSVAEFVTEARKRQEYIDLKARPRLPAPNYISRGKLAPFEIAKQKALTKYGHLPVLHENISFDQWKKLSAAREVPVGACWVACLATVFGPQNQNSQ